MASNNNQNEFFVLLDGTDSHSSEVQQLVIPPRKKRFRRKLRNNPSIRHDRLRSCPRSGRTVSLVVFSLAVVGWLVTLSWLLVILQNQVYRLNDDLKKELVAAHQGVPDALQACHTLSRELHHNQSEMALKLADMALLQGNLTSNLTRLQDGLSVVQQQLNASPSLVNDPRLVTDLSKQVAEFGSKIQDLQSTVLSLKEAETRHDGLLTIVGNNMSDLHSQVNKLQVDQGGAGVTLTQLADTKASILASLNQLVANVSKLNDTFNSKLKWTSEDQTRDHSTVESLQEMDQNITARLRTLEEIILKNAVPTTPPSPLGGSPTYPNAEQQKPTPVVTDTASQTQRELTGTATAGQTQRELKDTDTARETQRELSSTAQYNLSSSTGRLNRREEARGSSP